MVSDRTSQQLSKMEGSSETFQKGAPSANQVSIDDENSHANLVVAESIPTLDDQKRCLVASTNKQQCSAVP